MNPFERLLGIACTKLTVSLSCSMYLQPQPDRLDGMLRCFEDYCARWGSNLRWFYDSDSKKRRPVTAELLAYPHRRSARPHKKQELIWEAHGAELVGDASPWQVFGNVDPGATHALSLSCPVDVISVEAFLKAALAWFATASALHGYAGYRFNQCSSLSLQQVYLPVTHAAARRFSGIEIEDTWGTADRARDGLKSTNWLTMVSDELLDRIGGRQALRAKLSDAITIHDVNGGVLVQAGPEPGIGDVNREERLPLYREVARALKPLRMPKHYDFGFDEDGMGEAGTDAWLRRFDD